MSGLSLAEKKVYAKDKYFRYEHITNVARECEVNLATLKTWVYGTHSKKAKGWKVERELAKSQVLKDLTADKRGMVYSMVNGSMFLLHDFIEDKKAKVIKSGETISLKEAEKITNILTNLHRMIMDESGDGADTDSSFKKPTTIEEVGRRIKKADPFIKDEIVVCDVEDESKESNSSGSCDDDDIIIE